MTTVKGHIDHLLYRYHFQDKNNDLIFRYVNTPHFPGLNTYPNHKHDIAYWNESQVRIGFYRSDGTEKIRIQAYPDIPTSGGAERHYYTYNGETATSSLYSQTDGGGSCSDGSVNAAINDENRPQYLSCRFIMRIK